MWYFTWILGLAAAVLFGIINAMWHEFELDKEGDKGLSEIEG